MLYLKFIEPSVDSDEIHNSLLYICKNCNFQKAHTSEENSCIFKIDYNTENIKKNSFINPFIYEDITLPRAEGIKCPNVNCPKPKSEIIYIKYDNDNLKFIYICLDCYKAGNEPHIW